MIKIKENQRGVTLISLIITIMILIILLGLTVLTLPEGLFDKAKNANMTTSSAINDSQSDIDKITGYLPDITEEEGGSSSANYPPTMSSLTVTDITATTATVAAIGNDPEGDILIYKIDVKEENSETVYTNTSITGNFSVTGLKAHTSYTCTVTVTDTKNATETKTESFTTENTTPTVTASVTNLYTTTATITATGSDVDGDNLTYTLKIGSTTYQPSSTSTNSATFNITGLTEQTPYSYIVTARDGTDSGTATGNLTTWCSGTGYTHNLLSDENICENGIEYYPCDICDNSNGICYSTDIKYNDSWTIESYSICSDCGGKIAKEAGNCSTCGGLIERYVCRSCEYSEDYNDDGHFCNHSGHTLEHSVLCETHQLSGRHYMCSEHGYVGVSYKCTYCSHGKTEPHAI